MAQLEYRPVTTKEQIDQVARLADVIWNECYAGNLTPEQIRYMVDNFQSARALGRAIRKEGYEYFLLCRNNEPVGYLGVQAKDGKLLLSKIYLLAGQRGKGYADEMFAFMAQHGRQKGCTAMWLTVNKYNPRAIAAYKKRGFVEIRQQVVDIGGGYVMDDFVFEKTI